VIFCTDRKVVHFEMICEINLFTKLHTQHYDEIPPSVNKD